ncbi:type I-MYXAN CRISPR-associated protein Cas6/Cmx6 [Sulfuricystis multivorans]|uniref:type I-MYXAN CRISPR-associated protein Cas6/Cmx6 n=1 Tax=Sulfuricystis multivorans TaxID=2211108 RepID=UPI000F82641B|nr:type I-MYXAN CRISPR-associated protein Cas6/Cmx6 [Sulfuricystis multivorans]
MDEITSLDKFRVPVGNQEIELQHIRFAAGGVPVLRLRIREHRRFTIFDIDPVTAGRWAATMGQWSQRQLEVLGAGQSLVETATEVALTDVCPEIVDLQFVLKGGSVPFDHADALWQAIRRILPWMENEALAGVHPLSGLSPGEGVWYLARRSHLTLRLPHGRLAEARALVGAQLDLAGSILEVGAATEKALPEAPVLYSKFVTFGGSDAPDEEWFYTACQRALAALQVVPRSLVCGKRQSARTAEGMLHGFSLMVNGLDAEGAQRLMRYGLGIERKRGCGVFVPHKSNPADAATA